jgi:hypothetical protein
VYQPEFTVAWPKVRPSAKYFSVEPFAPCSAEIGQLKLLQGALA